MKKILIAYFSASGTTKGVAEKISSAINGDLFEIEPVNKYTKEDLDWTNKQSRSSIEMNDELSRPGVKNKVENITEYETILIGFPVWWYIAPTIINTFIEENNLSGKNVYVFVTSGGSGSDSSFNNLKSKYANINFISSKRLTGKESDDFYKDWIR